jgi:transposase
MIDRTTLWARIHMWMDNRSDPLADPEVAKYLAAHPEDLATYVRIESFSSAVRHSPPSDDGMLSSEFGSDRDLGMTLEQLRLGKSSAEVAESLGVSEDAVLTLVAAFFGALLDEWQREVKGPAHHRLSQLSTADQQSAPNVSAGIGRGSPTDKLGPLNRRPVPEEATEVGAGKFDSTEKTMLIRALHTTGGDKLAAAKLLGIGRSVLYRRLRRFGIE